MSTTRAPLAYFTRDASRVVANKRLRDNLIEKIEKKSPKSKRRGGVRLISAPKE